MIKVTRSSLVTAKLKTSCRTRRGRAIKYLGCSTLKIILILCYITGVYCERYEWRISRYFKDLRAAMGRRPQTSLLGHCNFEEICDWNWNPGEKFRRVTPATAGKLGPATDASNLKKGHFLWQQGRGQSQVSSNLIPRTGSHCYLEIAFYQYEMKETIIKLIIATADMTWVVAERLGNNDARWQIEKFNLGAITQPYHLYFEIDFPYLNSSLGIDNIRLVDCFPELPPDKTVCTEITFRCKNGSCLNRTRVCDLTKDCADGEDEEGDCDKMPENSRCNFENGWCGWTNVSGRLLNWNLHRGSTPHERLGPSYDHTYLNETGTFAYVNISRRSEYFSKGTIESPLFNPTPPYSSDPNSPYHQSCQVRFFYHQYGVASGSLGLYLVQVKPHQNHSEFLWWSYGDKSNDWFNEAIVLPEIKHRFFFQFEASQGYTTKGILAIDDFSLSPECFGIGVPPEVVGSFNYSNPIIESERIPDQHADFVNETVIRVTTCGATGRMGPTVEQCAQKYNKTDVKVVVPSLIPAVEGMPIYNLNGTQRWSAPHGGYYTLIGMGARGGRGSGDTGSTLGASVRGIIELEKGEQLYFMVGQAGTDACPKNLGQRMSECQMSERPTASTGVQSVLEKVRTMNVKDGGGGGGGATYIFTLKNNNEQHPLLIAAGGGGLGLGQFVDDGIQHGRGGAPPDKLPSSGLTITKDAGPGGGWNSSTNNILGHRIMSGMPLVRGGIGGTGCGTSLEGNGNGGFGGGGGGCLTGGGGGGYIGGSTGLKGSGNGEGGYSYAAPQLLHVSFKPEANPGPGEVYIIPAISGCGCDFRCVALDQYLSETKCLCSPGWLLGNDSRSCNMVNDTKVSHQAFMILLITVSIGLLLAFVGFCLLLYNRYQNRKALLRRRQVMFGNGTELTALRVVSDTMMTEFNPNYEFAGNLYSFKDLTQIPREYITLVKPLGQGAFGEVFQGIYKQRRNEEHPVAVKTLPCLTTFQAEADFMMEALIMSKFSHPNIVHFIGVSFEKHPRYIILELLAGGDLKNFLREERPKPDRPTTLTMHDLITCGSDIASGCKYMEEARFIHRDIAARNCLLTCKGPGRMVKIADFGMARDIYRSDYYRKGGKAMLPIKWMPPESFLDGIFTTKTDVWAFGVLLWELMSFGYMPYTGCANREVMTMVTSGGRLEKPAGCPDPIYGIMTRCWHPRPDDRPSFATITERLGYCLQDPDVINHPMPNYDLLPACDREITIMRPDPETECINVHSDTALLEMCGYIQSRDTEFRPSTYRIGAHVPSGTSYVCQKRSDYNPLNDNFRTRSKNAQLQQLHRNPHKNFRKDLRNVYGNNNAKDDDDRNDCKRKNDDDNDKDNDKNNDNDKEEGEAKNEVENKDKDETKDNNKMRPYECKKENDDDDNVDTTSKDVDETLSGHRDNTMIDIVDRKNGNESTTTTDTNSATPTDTPMDTPTDTATNSSPNTSTCSPSQTIANETSTTSTTNVNGMVKKSALKAALSLDPSALYRGAIHYEKISFSTSQLPSTTTSATTQTTTSSSSQRSAAPGSIELRKDLLGHKLPREEECSC